MAGLVRGRGWHLRGVSIAMIVAATTFFPLVFAASAEAASTVTFGSATLAASLPGTTDSCQTSSTVPAGQEVCEQFTATVSNLTGSPTFTFSLEDVNGTADDGAVFRTEPTSDPHADDVPVDVSVNGATATLNYIAPSGGTLAVTPSVTNGSVTITVPAIVSNDTGATMPVYMDATATDETAACTASSGCAVGVTRAATPTLSVTNTANASGCTNSTGGSCRTDASGHLEPETGDTVPFTLTVTNTSPSGGPAAYELALCDSLDTGGVAESVSNATVTPPGGPPSPTGAPPPGCPPSGNLSTSLPGGVTLLPGQSATETYTVTFGQTPAATDCGAAENFCSTAEAQGQSANEIPTSQSTAASPPATGPYPVLTAVSGSQLALDVTNPPPAVSPQALVFSSQLEQTSSAPQQVTITNDDARTMSVTGLVFTGADSGDFALTSNGCLGPLAVDASCVITVSFVPQGLGSRTATLEIQTSSTSPAAVALSGTGAAPSQGSSSPTGSPGPTGSTGPAPQSSTGPKGATGTHPTVKIVCRKGTAGKPLCSITFGGGSTQGSQTAAFKIVRDGRAVASGSVTLRRGGRSIKRFLLRPGRYTLTLTVGRGRHAKVLVRRAFTVK
ncbi:MAG TPA: choice-of-anchor D domain-containing protein [Solirubrobacteraceae bacterium]|nr:choice-of-anchor D domain-containing protein [Solirubrobacteraceae bacterium]